MTILALCFLHTYITLALLTGSLIPFTFNDSTLHSILAGSVISIQIDQLYIFVKNWEIPDHLHEHLHCIGAK
ncbi:hypothetical protein XELAEV_18002435mg [Xenopus laevis]|uniref:Uncharacterized protein n=1 Tax=Xenopus laevis TaxID=8355 RepID=A0A974BNQ8_XENLA|nr:hypothetical protein XELAEV_18002435mg [Xenopus laevis]